METTTLGFGNGTTCKLVMENQMKRNMEQKKATGVDHWDIPWNGVC